MWNNVDIAGCQKWIVGTLLGTDLSQGGKIQPHHVQKKYSSIPHTIEESILYRLYQSFARDLNWSDPHGPHQCQFVKLSVGVVQATTDFCMTSTV